MPNVPTIYTIYIEQLLEEKSRKKIEEVVREVLLDASRLYYTELFRDFIEGVMEELGLNDIEYSIVWDDTKQNVELEIFDDRVILMEYGSLMLDVEPTYILTKMYNRLERYLKKLSVKDLISVNNIMKKQ